MGSYAEASYLSWIIYRHSVNELRAEDGLQYVSWLSTMKCLMTDRNQGCWKVYCRNDRQHLQNLRVELPLLSYP
jgi:hypothetical protein